MKYIILVFILMVLSSCWTKETVVNTQDNNQNIQVDSNDANQNQEDNHSQAISGFSGDIAMPESDPTLYQPENDVIDSDIPESDPTLYQPAS